MFLDYCKRKILKKMLVTPHGYKSNAPNIGLFHIIPSMILSWKDKTSVEVVEIFLTSIVHNSHMLHNNLYGFFFFHHPRNLKFESLFRTKARPISSIHLQGSFKKKTLCSDTTWEGHTLVSTTPTYDLIGIPFQDDQGGRIKLVVSLSLGSNTSRTLANPFWWYQPKGE